MNRHNSRLHCPQESNDSIILSQHNRCPIRSKSNKFIYKLGPVTNSFNSSLNSINYSRWSPTVNLTTVKKVSWYTPRRTGLNVNHFIFCHCTICTSIYYDWHKVTPTKFIWNFLSQYISNCSSKFSSILWISTIFFSNFKAFLFIQFVHPDKVSGRLCMNIDGMYSAEHDRQLCIDCLIETLLSSMCWSILWVRLVFLSIDCIKMKIGWLMNFYCFQSYVGASINEGILLDISFMASRRTNWNTVITNITSFLSSFLSILSQGWFCFQTSLNNHFLFVCSYSWFLFFTSCNNFCLFAFSDSSCWLLLRFKNLSMPLLKLKENHLCWILFNTTYD